MKKKIEVAVILVFTFLPILTSGCNLLRNSRKTEMTGWIEYGEWTPFEFQRDMRREKYILENPQTDKEIADCISRGLVSEGMSMDEAEASWGEPTEKEIATGTDGLVYELWYYMRAADEYQFLLFRDGKLKKIQDKVVRKAQMKIFLD